LTLQSNATVGSRHRMHKALIKTIRRSELTPVSHRISDVTPSPTAGRRNYSIALHAESVRSRTLVLLFRVNVKITFRCWLRGHANRNGGRHEATVAFHYINVFLRERNQNTHFGWVVRFIRGDVIWTAGTHMPSRCATSKQQQ